MMTQDRDYEDALRRALAAAAESIEPGGDGLQRIRHRLDSRRSPRSVFSGFAEWLDLHGTRLLVRLDPLTEADPGRAAADRAAVGPCSPWSASCAGLLSPRGRPGGRRAPRAGQPARAPGARRGLAQAGLRGLGRRGHRGGRGGHPQPRDGNPDQPGEQRRHRQPGLQASAAAGRRRTPSGGSCRWGSRPSQPPGRAQRKNVQDTAARGGLHADPDARGDDVGPGRGRHGDARPRPRPGPRRARRRPQPTDTGHADAHPDDEPRHRRHGHRDHGGHGPAVRRRSARPIVECGASPKPSHTP